MASALAQSLFFLQLAILDSLVFARRLPALLINYLVGTLIIMFSTLGLFSKLDCPEEGRCSLLNCLFRHDSKQRHPRGEEQVVGASSHSKDDGARSRKRRRLESSPNPVDSTPRAGHADEAAKTGQPAARVKPITAPPSTQPPRAQAPDKATLQSTVKRVSPPPLRARPGQSPNKAEEPKAHRADKVKAVEKATAAIKNRQAGNETLNPRFLLAPPATHAFRYTVVSKLHEELVRLYKAHQDAIKGYTLSDQDMIKMALDEEEKVARESPVVYSNVVKLRIMALKKMTLEGWRKMLSAFFGVIEQDTDAKSTEAKAPKTVETGLTPLQELALLPRLQARMSELSQYGYVIAAPSPKDIEEARRGLDTARGWEVCDRCKTRFQVFPGRREDGVLASGGKCSYHWGKPFMPPRELGDKSHIEKKYACCNEPISTRTACTKAENHVFKAGEVKRMASVLQFVETPPNPNARTDHAICVDCEMCYTVYGMEMVRMTVTAWPSGEDMVDVLVRPMGEILDLNSRFSGITPPQLANAQPYGSDQGPSTGDDGATSALRIVPSPAAARDLLFTLISPETPVIGHALENDLGVLRLIHPFLVDSALLFPHRAGLPYRNSLKMLARRHLGREIQTNGAQAGSDPNKAIGHDSKEDAVVAGELIRWTIAKEWKKLERDGWSFDEGGVLTPPPTGPSRSVKPSSGATKSASSTNQMHADKQTPQDKNGSARDADEGHATEGNADAHGPTPPGSDPPRASKSSGGDAKHDSGQVEKQTTKRKHKESSPDERARGTTGKRVDKKDGSKALESS